MPRDMSGSGRWAPAPRFQPFAFYSAVRLGDPEMLAKIMACDPYFVTQDNGAGAPLHFAVTYCQLDMAHHLLCNGAAVNQRDAQAGWTPLHRAAHLAHLPGYSEIFEYLLSRGADPALVAPPADAYLSPEPAGVLDVAVEDEGVRSRLASLITAYACVPKAPEPHADIGDWWALYDYGPEAVASWPAGHQPRYPEAAKRARDKAAASAAKAARRAAAAAAMAAMAADGYAKPFTKDSLAALPGAAIAATAATITTAITAAPAAANSPMSVGRPLVPVALLFPGQGSQAVGMLGAAAARLPAVAAMLAEAEGQLGYDALALMQNGPRERLDDTAVAQPALFLASLAALEVLRSEQPKVADGFCITAGLSLGEYTALVAAGALSFSDGLKVVKARGEAMAAAAAASAGRPHGMLSVVGLTDDALQQLCADAVAARGEGTVCRVANFLFPQGRVVSGHLDALDVVAAAAGQLGALKAARLAVSGAFHTPLMEPARQALMEVLASVDIQPPRVPVLSNVTAAPFPADPDAIRALLGRQLVEPVRWEASLQAALAHQPGVGATTSASSSGTPLRLIEVGPGAQIKAMVRRVSSPAWQAFSNVSAA